MGFQNTPVLFHGHMGTSMFLEPISQGTTSEVMVLKVCRSLQGFGVSPIRVNLTKKYLNSRRNVLGRA